MVTYHGLTSWIQGLNVTSEAPLFLPTLSTYCLTDPVIEPILPALATTKHISVAPKLGDALLDAYFCYQVFNIIQRSTFLRDMAVGGSKFSEFLLMCMYASATRMIDGLSIEERRTQGELFEKFAKDYLAHEMEGPSKITTIQGLLLLSGRSCALGNIPQGWTYAGLAFRMIQDLGIHLAPYKVIGSSNLSFEEQATRDRLFCAAFIWDKSGAYISPRLGRDPSSMADFDDNDGRWTAYFANPLNCPPTLLSYVYQPKRRVATFRFLASLCFILHDIIMELYSTESRLSPRQRLAFIPKMQQRLGHLWKEVPSNMKFNYSQPSPPPWIFMFQMLYHTTNILLYRLIIDPANISTGNGHVATCLDHSITANQMAVSFTRTFGSRMTYVDMYSSFVAASFDIILLDFGQHKTQLAALARLRIWLGMMED
ncbi:fungal-specific transcription factor domain-containing protein [Xylariales sp. PMI_506]|nr:fungal-specific transcription factor domain-containing protein [Xylariales sp. PMI_506]